MAKERPLLERLLSAPDITQIVPRLQPEVLHRVVQQCGLEACTDFVALATPAQLERVLDIDVWRAPAPGADEQFDADRFGLWLDVLMQSGAAIASEKIAGMDIRLITSGLARHVRVFEYAAVAPFTTLDGEQAGGRRSSPPLSVEVGGYLIEARRPSAWDAIVELFAHLDAERPEYFHRVMRGCVRLSSGAREADGFHDLLSDREQDDADLAGRREFRRDTQGYVSPGQARAFLQGAREHRVDREQPAPDPVARAYFRAVGVEPSEADEKSDRVSDGDASTSDVSQASQPDPAAMADVLDTLRDAGVIARPRALLAAPDAGESRLALVGAWLESRADGPMALAFLANVLLTGCAIQGRAFTEREASDAAVATCNLGLEHWPAHWPDVDLVSAFQVGWAVLHRDVSLYAASRLIDIVAGLECRDRDIQLQLSGLRAALARHERDGEPWRARRALEVIVMLDAPSWAALMTLLDECPAVHAAVGAAERGRRSFRAEEFEFVSESRQIAAVQAFLDALPDRLTG